jgi:hypothetical protein
LMPSSKILSGMRLIGVLKWYGAPDRPIRGWKR